MYFIFSLSCHLFVLVSPCLSGFESSYPSWKHYHDKGNIFKFLPLSLPVAGDVERGEMLRDFKSALVNPCTKTILTIVSINGPYMGQVLGKKRKFFILFVLVLLLFQGKGDQRKKYCLFTHFNPILSLSLFHLICNWTQPHFVSMIFVVE